MSFFRVKWLQPAMEGTSCVCVSNPVPKGGSFFAIFVVRFFRPMIKTGGLPDL